MGSEHMTAICGVEKLEFQPRSQFRRPLAVSMEISLGVRRRDRSFCVQPSLRPCRGDYPCRRHYTRGSETFLAPQFPTFSSISAHSGRPESTSSGLADRGRVHSRWAISRPLRARGGRGSMAPIPAIPRRGYANVAFRRHARMSPVVGLKASITLSSRLTR